MKIIFKNRIHIEQNHRFERTVVFIFINLRKIFIYKTKPESTSPSGDCDEWQSFFFS